MSVPLYEHEKIKTLPALYSQENVEDPLCLVRLHNVFGPQCWFLLEYDPVQRIAFGYCDLGFGFPELGYVSLTELDEVQHSASVPVAIDIDAIWEPKPLSVVKLQQEQKDHED